MTEFDLLEKIVSLKWEEFTQADWELYQGCETCNPKIAYDGDYVFVVDGNRLCYYETKSDGAILYHHFELGYKHSGECE